MILFLGAVSQQSLGQTDADQRVVVGLDNLRTYGRMLNNKRLGVITNHSGINREGKTTVEVLSSLPGTRVVAIFSPEHGFDGKFEAGVEVQSLAGSSHPIPIYSLYGQTRKPTPQMLQDVEALVFDIQDVGARFYTYLSTLAVSMEAAAEIGIPFVVLDRPNPLGGRHIEGPLLDPKFASFIGLYPIPVRYGLTIAELARLINDQGWLKDSIKANLTVIPLEQWTRSTWWDQTGLPFIPPSPNIRTLEAAIAYPGTCLIEGTNLSEGRGTDKPFLQFGAPWINGSELANTLNSLKLGGVFFRSAEFKPTSSKCQGQICRGCEIVITDRDLCEPFWTGVRIIETLARCYPHDFKFLARHFDLLCGTDSVRLCIEQKGDLVNLKTQWKTDSEIFRSACKSIVLYKRE